MLSFALQKSSVLWLWSRLKRPGNTPLGFSTQASVCWGWCSALCWTCSLKMPTFGPQEGSACPSPSCRTGEMFWCLSSLPERISFRSNRLLTSPPLIQSEQNVKRWCLFCRFSPAAAFSQSTVVSPRLHTVEWWLSRTKLNPIILSLLNLKSLIFVFSPPALHGRGPEQQHASVWAQEHHHSGPVLRRERHLPHWGNLQLLRGPLRQRKHSGQHWKRPSCLYSFPTSQTGGESLSRRFGFKVGIVWIWSFGPLVTRSYDNMVLCFLNFRTCSIIWY